MPTKNSTNLRVIITGATGMVGKGVLLQCLDDQRVATVLVINRQTIGLEHPKLTEIIHKDFYDLSGIEHRLAGYDACFFCLGVSAFRMKENDYHRITYDLTIHMAETLLKLNPGMCFCYVSGQGTASSEKGSMWARIKGKTENRLLSMPFRSAFMFRPGYIQPMRNIRSRTAVYNAVYVVLKPLYPLLKKIAPNALTTNEAVGKAMIHVAAHGYPKKHLDPGDINMLAGE
jgi:uncharacterized protein YbjT (DUF2867 family)